MLLERNVIKIIGKRDVAFLTGLGNVVEDHRAVLDRDVLLVDRCQPVAVVGLGIRLAADPEEAKIKKPEGGAQCTLVRHPFQLQILRYRLPGRWQSGGNFQHSVVLQSIPFQPPLLVIEVLPPASVVGANRLEVSVGHGADPHLLPSGRNDQQLAALNLFGVEAVAGLIQIEKSFPGAPPGPSRISR